MSTNRFMRWDAVHVYNFAANTFIHVRVFVWRARHVSTSGEG